MNETNETNKITVAGLRRAGVKVRVTHRRYSFDGHLYPIRYFRENKLQELINSKGGYTTVEITTNDGKDFRVEAICNKKDGFNRKYALALCMERFQKKLNSN